MGHKTYLSSFFDLSLLQKDNILSGKLKLKNDASCLFAKKHLLMVTKSII